MDKGRIRRNKRSGSGLGVNILDNAENKKGIEAGTSTPSQNNTNLKPALGYVQLLGWAIFPINYKSKTPITQHGFKDATRDLQQIKQWWTKYPNAGIGLPTGTINNVFVIDIDVRNNGHISFDNLLSTYGELPHTVECLTGGGGNHYYFKWNERINKSSLQDFEGIDVQGNGKYVVLPPSTHPSGNRYEWELSSRPVENNIAPAPNWLIDLLSKKHTGGKYQARPTEHFLRILKGVSDGERTNSMTSLIGHLLAKNIDYRIAYELVLLWNERNNPPHSIDEVTKTFNNYLRMEIEKKKG